MENLPNNSDPEARLDFIARLAALQGKMSPEQVTKLSPVFEKVAGQLGIDLKQNQP